MPKLSPNYRNDSTSGLSPKLKAYLDAHFLQELQNLHTPNPKLLVVFSGGNGVGKSALAAKIGKELHGLILENDEIKLRLIDFDPALTRDERNVLTWQYSMDLYERLGTITPNGLIVRDGIIHWYYDRILPVFERQGYSIFIVGYDVSKEKSIELIKNRGDKPTVSTARLIELLDDHEINMARFLKVYTPDIILSDDTLFNHDAVINAVRGRLAEISSKKHQI